MERAQALVVDPGALQRDVLADDLHDVGAVPDLGDFAFRDQRHVTSFSRRQRKRFAKRGAERRAAGGAVKQKCLPVDGMTGEYGLGPRTSQFGTGPFPSPWPGPFPSPCPGLCPRLWPTVSGLALGK